MKQNKYNCSAMTDMDYQDRKITKVMVTTNSLYCVQGKLYVSKINSKLNSKL